MLSAFDFIPAAPYLDIGRNWFASPACPDPFSGSVLSVRRYLLEPVP
jgi:hypothetical protein